MLVLHLRHSSSHFGRSGFEPQHGSGLWVVVAIDQTPRPVSDRLAESAFPEDTSFLATSFGRPSKPESLMRVLPFSIINGGKHHLSIATVALAVVFLSACGQENAPSVVKPMPYTNAADRPADVDPPPRPATPSTPSSGSSTISVSGDGYSARVPSGWTKASDWYSGKTSGTRFKWTSASNSDVWVLIETTPGDSTGNLASAQSVANAISNASGISVNPVSLAGDSNSAVINFRRDSSELGDYVTRSV